MTHNAVRGSSIENKKKEHFLGEFKTASAACFIIPAKTSGPNRRKKKSSINIRGYHDLLLRIDLLGRVIAVGGFVFASALLAGFGLSSALHHGNTPVRC
jgi:hypothetical protein